MKLDYSVSPPIRREMMVSACPHGPCSILAVTRATRAAPGVTQTSSDVASLDEKRDASCVNPVSADYDRDAARNAFTVVRTPVDPIPTDAKITCDASASKHTSDDTARHGATQDASNLKQTSVDPGPVDMLIDAARDVSSVAQTAHQDDTPLCDASSVKLTSVDAAPTELSADPSSRDEDKDAARDASDVMHTSSHAAPINVDTDAARDASNASVTSVNPAPTDGDASSTRNASRDSARCDTERNATPVNDTSASASDAARDAIDVTAPADGILEACIICEKVRYYDYRTMTSRVVLSRPEVSFLCRGPGDSVIVGAERTLLIARWAGDGEGEEEGGGVGREGGEDMGKGGAGGVGGVGGREEGDKGAGVRQRRENKVGAKVGEEKEEHGSVGQDGVQDGEGGAREGPRGRVGRRQGKGGERLEVVRELKVGSVESAGMAWVWGEAGRAEAGWAEAGQGEAGQGEAGQGEQGEGEAERGGMENAGMVILCQWASGFVEAVRLSDGSTVWKTTREVGVRPMGLCLGQAERQGGAGGQGGPVGLCLTGAEVTPRAAPEGQGGAEEEGEERGTERTRSSRGHGVQGGVGAQQGNYTLQESGNLGSSERTGVSKNSEGTGSLVGHRAERGLGTRAQPEPSLFVVDEKTAALLEMSPTSGRVLRTLPIPGGLQGLDVAFLRTPLRLAVLAGETIVLQPL